MSAWLIALALARSMDAATTVYALNQPGLAEGNKWMPKSPAGQIAVQAGIGTAKVWVLRKVAPHHPNVAKGLAIVQIGISGTVASLNIRVIRSVK